MPAPSCLPRFLALLPVLALSAQAHLVHGTDSRGRLLAGYDAKVRPPAAAAGADGTAVPSPAAVFAPFAPAVRTRWDDTHFYVESDGMPDHPLMVGITAWQQQVPIPQRYFGANAWRFPLVPVPAARPLSARDRFFRGAIAIAANGVPIFNPIKNDGRTDTLLAGELDGYGGHAGRADDYHYHVAPLHLAPVVGAGRPIAYALDGYAIHGLTCGVGEPADLDAFNGHATPGLGYHYHATRKYPYINGGFHGEVVERDGQVDPQPRAEGPRPATQPLRGAKVTGFKRLDGGYQIAYELRGRTQFINYAPRSTAWVFEYVAADGASRTEIHDGTRRGGGDGGRSRGGRDRAGATSDDPAGGATRRPWILVHAAEMDANRDGRLTRDEVLAQVARTFAGYARDGAERLSTEALVGSPTVRSALGGFVQQHAGEIDANEDGFVTAAELATTVLRMFDRARREAPDLPAAGAPTERRGGA